MRVTIEQLNKALSSLPKRIMTATFRATFRFAQIFLKSKFDYGNGYKKLTKKYAIWKAKHYGIKPILVRTGHLKSVTSKGYRVIKKKHGVFLKVKETSYSKYVRQDRDFLEMKPRDKKYFMFLLRQELRKTAKKFKGS